MSQFSHDNVVCVSEQLRCMKHLFTKIRDQRTPKVEFVTYSKRLMGLICEEGLTYVDQKEKVITTPTGSSYCGASIDPSNMTVVSIIRAGDAFLDVVLNIVPEASVGKILIQRNEETAEPVLYYCKLPKLDASKQVILLDPMLATGGSAKAAVKVLLEHGAAEDKITFFNVVSCPEGLRSMTSAYPRIKIITGHIDEGLDSKAYILPGLGDFGDRFYGLHDMIA